MGILERAGCWGCTCFPIACALFQKRAISEDELEHTGCCFLGPVPFCPFTERRRRKKNTNGFYKMDDETNIDWHSSPSAACNGLSCSMRICKQSTEPVLTQDVDGKWICCCLPLFWAYFTKTQTNADTVIHKGCCFFGPIPLCPFNEPWVRVPGTNNFRSHSKPSEADMYFGPNCVLHGASCSRKCC